MVVLFTFQVPVYKPYSRSLVHHGEYSSMDIEDVRICSGSSIAGIRKEGKVPCYLPSAEGPVIEFVVVVVIIVLLLIMFLILLICCWSRGIR